MLPQVGISMTDGRTSHAFRLFYTPPVGKRLEQGGGTGGPTGDYAVAHETSTGYR
jgi:hypothetical protein